MILPSLGLRTEYLWLLNLALRVVVVWPTYVLLQILHDIRYITFFVEQSMLCLRGVEKVLFCILFVGIIKGQVLHFLFPHG